MMRITDTVKHLLIINVIFYVVSKMVGPGAYDLLAMHFPVSPEFKFWQPITYMFMHDALSVRHLLSNMLLLFFIGPSLEDVWGSKKFIFFYISCGLGAIALHMGIDYFTFAKALSVIEATGLTRDQIVTALSTQNFNVFQGKIDQETFTTIANPFYGTVVGASGALYGIMVAYAFLFPNREIMLFLLPIPIKVKYLVSVTILGDLYMGFRGTSIFGGNSDGIAHFAHLGGALIGFIMMWYWKNNQFNNRRWN